MKKAIVSGASGFIGCHLVEQLLDNKWDVNIIVREKTDLKPIESFLNKLTVNEHDGTTECMVSIFNKVKPDITFHLASLFLAKHESKDVVPLMESNIIFSSQLIEAMAVSGASYLINTGTSWQHYKNEKYNPVCLYAATKQAFEDIAKFYIDSKNIKMITLKLFDTYGPNDKRKKIFNLLHNASKSNETLLISKGEQLIDLVYIDDVIDAYFLALKRIQDSRTKIEEFAVSSGNPITLKELVSIYEKTAEKSISVKWGALPYREREVMIPWNHGVPLPMWRPKISIEEGIKRILAIK